MANKVKLITFASTDSEATIQATLDAEMVLIDNAGGSLLGIDLEYNIDSEKQLIFTVSYTTP